MSHPSLGLPPRDLHRGHPDDAARLVAQRSLLAAKTLEAAIATDPTIGSRYDEEGLRRLLNDADILVEALSVAVASDDPEHLRHWAEMTAPVYRRRRVPMDDLCSLADGLRRAAEGVCSAEAMRVAGAALDAAIRSWRSTRRLGGDARRRNRILAAVYKGG